MLDDKNDINLLDWASPFQVANIFISVDTFPALSASGWWMSWQLQNFILEQEVFATMTASDINAVIIELFGNKTKKSAEDSSRVWSRHLKNKI